MTYLKNGTEYLTPDDKRVWDAVQYLAGQGRTANNSQVAEATGLPRTRVRQIATQLRRRNYLRDASPAGCAAYHWRITDKLAITEDWAALEAAPEPYSPPIEAAEVRAALEAAEQDGTCHCVGGSAYCPNCAGLWTPERAADPLILASYGGELLGGPVAYGDQSCIRFPDMHSAASWAEATCMRKRASFAAVGSTFDQPVQVWLDHKQSGR